MDQVRRSTLPRSAAAACFIAAVALVAGPQDPVVAASSLGIPACAATQLTGVSTDSADDGWAVGFHLESAEQALVLHWDGSSWSRATLPSLGPESYLSAVDAFSPTMAVAVGMHRVGNQFRTLVLSWDGHQWTRVPSPTPKTRENDLYGVTILSADDAWAVGSSGFAKTLILHWNGTTWSRVPSPSPTNFDFLQSVSGATSDDVWAVGASDPGTLALHWDGTVWSRVTSLGHRPLDVLFGVTAVGSTDVWAVGTYTTSSRLDRALTERWRGDTWQQFDAPSPGNRINKLYGVDSLGREDVWAVGKYRNDQTSYGLAERWDGTEWTRFDIAGSGRTLNSVSMTSPDDVWAVGHRDGSTCLIEHWDGSRWSLFTQ